MRGRKQQRQAYLRRLAIKRRHEMKRLRQLGYALRRRQQEEQAQTLPVVPFEDAVSAQPIEVYDSLDEARTAVATRELLTELRDDMKRRSGLGLGLAIGLSVVAVLGLGVVLCYVLFRKDGTQLAAPPMPYPLPYPIPQLGPATSPVIKAPQAEPKTQAAREILDYFKARRGA